MKVTVIYNQGSLFETNSEQQIADRDTYLSAKQVYDSLVRNGHTAVLYEMRPDNYEMISKIKTEVIFNLCEWSGRDYPLAIKVLEILETMNIPFTGTNKASMKWSADKVVMKGLFEKYKIPTPAYVIYKKSPGNRPLKKSDSIPYPLLIKPALEHCGIGIHQSSIVPNYRELKKRVARLRDLYKQPILVEEYIEGREIQVTVINNGEIKILPPAEIIFSDKPGMKKIFSFESKWQNEREESNYEKTIVAKMDRRLKIKMMNLCKKIYTELNCVAYIRIDTRVRDGQIFVLEVNVDPGLDADPEYGMYASCIAEGWSFDGLVEEIVKAALLRFDKENIIRSTYENRNIV